MNRMPIVQECFKHLHGSVCRSPGRGFHILSSPAAYSIFYCLNCRLEMSEEMYFKMSSQPEMNESLNHELHYGRVGWNFDSDKCSLCYPPLPIQIVTKTREELEKIYPGKEELFEFQVKGFYELRDPNPQIGPVCTCPTLLNGHWDGCPLRG